MNKRIVIIFLSLIFLNSCVAFHKTQDIRDTINSNVDQTNQNYSKVKADYEQKNKIFESLKSNVISVSAPSFRLISDKKIAFDSAYQNLTKTKEDINRSQQQFEQLVVGKSKIKSNEPEWDELKQIKSDITFSTGQLNGLGESYISRSNSLGAAINKSHYKSLKKSTFSSQIQKNIDELNNSLLKINGQLKLFDNEMRKAYLNNQINDSTYQSKQEISARILTELNNMEAAVKRLAALESRFQRRYKKLDEIWVGENTKPNELMKKIESKINIIKKAQIEFQSLSNALKPNTE